MMTAFNGVSVPKTSFVSTGLPPFWRIATLATLLALALGAPLFIYPILLMKILCFALFASAFNLLLGFGGLLSFGHAAYFGAAAYITAHAAKVWGLPIEIALLSGTMVSAALGFLFGILAVRRSGIYFAMITLAFAQMIYFLALKMPFTHGEDGIQAVPRGMLLGIFDLRDNLFFYYVVLAITGAGVLAVWRIVHSPFGDVLKAIRENETRAISLGYDIKRYKICAFVLSAALSGLAGATKTIVFGLASLADVHWSTSGDVVLMTLIGGVGTLTGPILGAAFIVWMHDYLAQAGSWLMVIQGVFFVVCVTAFREGVVGLFKKVKQPRFLRWNV